MLNDFEWLFLDYCKNNNLNGLKRILNHIDIFTIKDASFKEAIYNGNLDIAKWLYSLDKNYKKSTLQLVLQFSCTACFNRALYFFL